MPTGRSLRTTIGIGAHYFQLQRHDAQPRIAIGDKLDIAISRNEPLRSQWMAALPRTAGIEARETSAAFFMKVFRESISPISELNIFTIALILRTAHFSIAVLFISFS